MLTEEEDLNEQEPLDEMVGKNHSLIIEDHSTKLYWKPLFYLERPQAIQMNQASEIDYLTQRTNYKDYLRLEQVKNEVLYLNCEGKQKGPKKLSLYL